MKSKTGESSKKISVIQKELDFKNQENEKLTAQLALVNKEVVFQHEENKILAAELVIAQIEITFHNGEKQKREAELIGANLELVFKNQQNDKCAARLSIVNKQLVKTEEDLTHLHIELKQNVAQRNTELTKIEKRFRALIENSTDMKTIATPDGKLVFGSPSITKVLGYSLEEFFKIPVAELIHPDDISGFSEKIPFILQTPGASFYSRHRLLHKNGNWLWCEGTVTNMLEEESIQGLVFNFRDITAKKTAEDEMLKANRMYAFISAINQSIVHITDEETLLKRACKIAVDIGKFRMAWIGMRDEKTNKVIPVSYAGAEDEYLSKIKTISVENIPEGEGPTGTAFRQRKSIVCNDIETDSRMALWKEEALVRGYFSSISLPIIKSGKTIGTFSLYASEKNFFDDAEIKLLEEAAGDISFALENFELKVLRHRAEEKLSQLNMRFQLATNSSGMGIWDWDIETNILTWDEGMHKLFKTDDLQYGSVYDGWISRLHPKDKQRVINDMQLALKGGKEYNSEFRIIWSDGSVHYMKASGIVERDAAGNARRMIGANWDITELKEKNEQLRESEEFTKGVLRSLSSHIAVIDKTGTIVKVNESWNRFSINNGETSLQRTSEGSNYFTVCEKSASQGDSSAAEALEGLKAVMEEKTPHFYLEYPCDSPYEEKWFAMRVMKFDSKEAMIVVVHENITTTKKAEQERDNTLLELEERVEARTKDLADKNKDITDSINYAKRIQLGLLPRESQLTKIFPKSFVFSEPQNIVSGDFFWCHQLRNKKFIVVADCTGHGVPGALMSIIGNNLLNRIIVEEHIENPSEILEFLNERLTVAVKGDFKEVKDGMDIALCMIDTSFNEIYFAGAYQPVFIADENGKINELAASRCSIGAGIDAGDKLFKTERYSIIPGQRIYLSSDGYYSQFGGGKNKKFMKSRFRKTLEDIQSYPIEKHGKLLQSTFNDWAGTNEQVDDVLVVGIEL